jgi:hypothetical protein
LKYPPLIKSRFAVISFAWLSFMVIAVAFGMLREAVLTPWFGELRAHQMGTLVVCLLIAGVIGIAIKRLQPTPTQALGVGFAWVVMTVAFEIGVFHFIVGHPITTLLADYNLAAGRLWPLVLLTELLTPWWLARRGLPRRVVPRSGLPHPSLQHKSIHPLPFNQTRLPEHLRRSLSHEEIADLPIKRYEGEIQVINTATALNAAMHDIRQQQVVGFDTETRPAFNKGERYLPCLAQVATARAVYLLQLEQLDCSQALAELMSAPHIVKSGVALAGDVKQLKQLFTFEASAVVDVGQVAKRHGNTQTGLRNLTALFLGWRMAKGARTTNWATPELSSTQIGYAATDAWASRELYVCFQQLGLLSAGEQGAHSVADSSAASKKHSV